MSGIIGTSKSKSGVIGRSQDTAKAWVNFNQTSSPAIQDDFNVSTLDDMRVGVTRVNFINSMSNSDYAFAGSATSLHQNTSGSNGRVATVSPNLSDTYSTTGIALSVKDSSDAVIDSTRVTAIIFGD